MQACLCVRIYRQRSELTSGLCAAPCRAFVSLCSPVCSAGGHVRFPNPTFHSFTRKDLQASTALARRQRVPAVWKSREQPCLLLPASRVRSPGKQWSLAPGEEPEARRTAGRTHTCTYPSMRHANASHGTYTTYALNTQRTCMHGTHTQYTHCILL